jgi:tetratricopeptide (TPR) repeat protein
MNLNAAPPSRLARVLKDEKSFKTAVTLLLAALTAVTSLIIIFNVRASTRAAEAGRDGRILAIRYLTHLDRSQWELAAEKDIAVFYKELSGLMYQAQAYEGIAAGPGDALFYKLSRERLARIRDVLAKDGELTRPPYFNPQAGAPDLLSYYLDRIFVPAAEILERQEQKKAESAFWGSKSDLFTSSLAVMAVAVFLLTLSIVLSGRIRFFMAGSGLALIGALVVLAAVTETRTWRGPSDESVRLFVRATGQGTRAQILFSFDGDSAATLAAAALAEADIDRVLAAEPGYLAALQLKARIRTLKGETLFYGGKPDESVKELENAAADYALLIGAGQTPGYNYWSRGYAEFLLGRRDACERSFEQALKLLPEQGFYLGAVKAAGLLIGGKGNAAGKALDAAIEFARTKPLASDAIVFRTILQNLGRFQELRPTAGLPEMILRLKEAAVSLAVLKKSRPGDEKTEIAAIRFVAPVYDKRGDIIDTPPSDTFPKSTARAYFLLELKGMERGQSIVRKVYRRFPGRPFWIEQLLLGRAEHWEGPPEARLLGDVENPIPEAGEVLSGGDYKIEIFIEGRLKATGAFKIL